MSSPGPGRPRFGRQGAPPRIRPAARVRLQAIFCVLGGLLALVAAYTPWWYDSNVRSGTSSTTSFLPGGSLYAGGGGGGGDVPYSVAGLASIGVLYEIVFATLILLTLLAFVVAGIGFARSGGRGFSREVRRLSVLGSWILLIASVAIVAATPFVQPVLYGQQAPAGTCSAPSSAGPCHSFWGTTSAGGSTITWGAGTGWGLAVAGAATLALGVSFGTSAPVTEREAARDSREAV